MEVFRDEKQVITIEYTPQERDGNFFFNPGMDTPMMDSLVNAIKDHVPTALTEGSMTHKKLVAAQLYACGCCYSQIDYGIVDVSVSGRMPEEDITDQFRVSITKEMSTHASGYDPYVLQVTGHKLGQVRKRVHEDLWQRCELISYKLFHNA